MGSIFSKTEEEHKKEIERLENKVKLQKQTIIEQLHTIKLLREKEDGEYCINNGIVQVGGAEDICQSIECTKNRKDYEYIVFSGGGVKGLSFCGALDVISQLGGLSFVKGYAGTSAGSIVASLLAIGYTVNEVKDIVMDMDFKKFIDDEPGVIRDAVNLVDDYGLCPGNYFYDYMGKLIEEKTGSADYTIEDLFIDSNIELVIVTTDLNRLRTIYFYHNNPIEGYRKIPIRHAVRASMSIPFLFEPIECDGNLCVDGGVLDNYAIHAFDGDYPGDKNARLNMKPPNPKVLGLKISSADSIITYAVNNRNDIENFYQYTTSYINIFLAENDRRIMTPGNFERTIHIITPYYPLTNFDLTDKEKEDLIDCGTRCAATYFS